MEPEGMEKAWTRKARITKARTRAMRMDSPNSCQRALGRRFPGAGVSPVLKLSCAITKKPGKNYLVSTRGGLASIRRGKLILGGSTNGADPVIGQVFKRSVGGYVIIGVALGRIIDITADLALIFLHVFLLKG